MLVALLLWAGPARADHVSLLAHKGPKKTRVLVLRQELDFKHGFDRYYLEEYEAPKNARVKRIRLGPADLDPLVRHGQYELYMQAVEADRETHLAAYREDGFEPVHELPLPALSRGDRLPVPARDGAMELRLDCSGRHHRVLLVREGDEYRLMRFKDPWGREVETVRRALAQVALLNDGRMLAVVVTHHLLPSPRQAPQEHFYFYPLRRASKRLGFDYPLELAAPEDENTP